MTPSWTEEARPISRTLASSDCGEPYIEAVWGGREYMACSVIYVLYCVIGVNTFNFKIQFQNFYNF